MLGSCKFQELYDIIIYIKSSLVRRSGKVNVEDEIEDEDDGSDSDSNNENKAESLVMEGILKIVVTDNGIGTYSI